MTDIEHMLDNAAMASQHPALLEPEVREAIKLNIIDPLTKKNTKPYTLVERRIPDPDTVILTEADMSRPEFLEMLRRREIVKAIHDQCVKLVEAEKNYDEAWDVLVKVLQA